MAATGIGGLQHATAAERTPEMRADQKETVGIRVKYRKKKKKGITVEKKGPEKKG